MFARLGDIHNRERGRGLAGAGLGNDNLGRQLLGQHPLDPQRRARLVERIAAQPVAQPLLKHSLQPWASQA